MSAIDFRILRQQVALLKVLGLVGFTATMRRGPQLRGPCPVHGSVPRPGRRPSHSFAAHLTKNSWHCFRCGASGNALDLYLAVTKLPVYQGALDLCVRLGLAVPRLPAVSPVSRLAMSQEPRRPP